MCCANKHGRNHNHYNYIGSNNEIFKKVNIKHKILLKLSWRARTKLLVNNKRANLGETKNENWLDGMGKLKTANVFAFQPSDLAVVYKGANKLKTSFALNQFDIHFLIFSCDNS